MATKISTRRPFSNSLEHIFRLRLLALDPVFLAAILTTGYQYSLVMLADSATRSTDWRHNLVQSLGFSAEEINLWSIVLAGFVYVASTAGIALFAAGMVERFASSKTERAFDTGVIYSALLFALLMPPAATVFHIVFGMTFGLLLGHLVFGGEGKSFLNPALVGVALVQISFPASLGNDPIWSGLNGYAGTNLFDAYHARGPSALAWNDITWWGAVIGNVQGMIGVTCTLAVALGGLILIYGRIASWRLILAQVIGVFIAASVANIYGGGMLSLQWYWHVVLGSFAFGAVFIATDPSSSACTNTGRWIQGLLVGLLVVVLRTLNPSHPDGMVSVLLLASMMAPAIDHLVVMANIHKRRGVHG